MSHSVARWLVLVITLAVPVVLILTNVLLFMNPAWLAYQYSKPDFPPSVRFTPNERYHFAAESIEYVRGNRTLEQFKALGVYDDREIKHMIDVRELVDRVKVVLLLTAALLLGALVVLARHKENRTLVARGLFNGATLTIGFFVAVGLFAALGFQTFFTLFHRIFFEGDSWLFNYTDSLIQFYPLPFWYETSLALVGLTVLEAIGVGLISRYVNKIARS